MGTKKKREWREGVVFLSTMMLIYYLGLQYANIHDYWSIKFKFISFVQ
jgi:hypothetical protein